MFRNIRFYRVSTPWPESEQALSDILTKCSFVPCGPLTEKRSGWEAPARENEAMMCRRVGGADLLVMRTQSRLLPVAAINDALEGRIEDYKSRMLEEPSRSVLRRLKQETRDELLPKTLVKSERIHGFFLLAEKLLAVDAASETKAERFLDLLRASFQGFEFTPLSFAQAPGDLLTAIFLGENIEQFAPGQECQLQDLSEQKSVATWRNTNLADSSIRQHVIDGMKLTRLGVVYNDILNLVIADDGALSKIKFADAEAADVTADEDPLARLDAEFVLLTSTLRSLVLDMKKLLGGYAKPQASQAADAA